MKNGSVYDRMTNAEKEVAKTLKEFGIQWSYEQPIFIWDENKRPRVWTPDFYLIQFNIYIEVCGSQNFNYNYRKKIFEKNQHQVIFLHLYKKQFEWKKHLLKYLCIFNYKREKKLDFILCKIKESG